MSPYTLFLPPALLVFRGGLRSSGAPTLRRRAELPARVPHCEEAVLRDGPVRLQVGLHGVEGEARYLDPGPPEFSCFLVLAKPALLCFRTFPSDGPL